MLYKVRIECQSDDKTAIYTSVVQASDDIAACYRSVAETRRLHPNWLDYDPIDAEVIAQ